MAKEPGVHPLLINDREVLRNLWNQKGKSWARFYGLHHGNPGMKTVGADREAVEVWGSELYPLPPVEVVFCFFFFYGSTRPD